MNANLNFKVFDEKSNRNTEIKTKQEYEQLVPLLPKLEYNKLKQSIKENNGNIIPIIVNKERIILDGNNRSKACLELGLKPRIEIHEF